MHGIKNVNVCFEGWKWVRLWSWVERLNSRDFDTCRDQTVRGACPGSCTGPEVEADRSLPATTDVRNAWSCTVTPHTSAWRGACAQEQGPFRQVHTQIFPWEGWPWGYVQFMFDFKNYVIKSCLQLHLYTYKYNYMFDDSTTVSHLFFF
jgi:hypothetical protein